MYQQELNELGFVNSSYDAIYPIQTCIDQEFVNGPSWAFDLFFKSIRF